MATKPMLTLVRENYAKTVAHSDRMEQLYSRIASHQAKSELRQCMPLWDVLDAEMECMEKEDAQFSQQIEALYLVTSPAEFTADEHTEMQTLLETGTNLAQQRRRQVKKILKDAHRSL